MLAVATSCQTEPASDAAGYAYIAPASVNLRPAVTDRSSTVAVLHFSERVQILEVRRRYARIHTRSGAEGWIDATQLLTPEQMNGIREAQAQALRLPSEGRATVFEALNVHLEPNRQAAAFAQIPDNGSVEVLAHKLAPKLTGPPKIPVFVLPQTAAETARKERKAKKAQTALRLPSPPPPPTAPADWLEQSSKPHPVVKPVPSAPKKPPLLEDCTLVRTKDKQCGWVLSRNLIMSIPDEVAQYAEGKRITSYFDLGTVQDEEKGPHHNWLWTTAATAEQFDFDGWRVFLWNRRRHRYETSYRDRDVEGYFPVVVDPGDGNSLVRTFRLILKNDNGALIQNQYTFDSVRVHLTGSQPYEPGQTGSDAKTAAAKGAQQPAGGWLKKMISNLRKRLSGSD